MPHPALQIAEYSFDDDLIDKALTQKVPAFRVYRPAGVMVVLGRASKPEEELNLETCLEDKINVLRRRGGGCSVVLDPGNIIVSVALPAPGVAKINEHFDWFCASLTESLAAAGVSGVYRDGIADLVINDRKVAGLSMYRKRDVVFMTASVLFNPDIALMERYLKHPPREPKYRRKRSHREFVAPCTAFGCLTTLDKAVDVLETRFHQILSGQLP